MRKLIRGGTIFLCLALMGAVLLSGCDFLNPPEGGASPLSTPPPPRLTPVAAGSTADTSVKVKRNDLSAQVKLRGRVVATTELNLSFRRAGWIKSLGVEIGDQVEQGTLLAELEDPDLEERLTAARSALELGRSTLAQAQLPLSPGRIAAAAETVAAAEYEVETSKLWLEKLKTPPTEEDLAPYRSAVAKARVKVTLAQAMFDAWAFEHGLEASPEARELELATLDMMTAQAALTRTLQGPSAPELAIAQANIRSAEARLQVAKANYQYEVQTEQGRAQQRAESIRSAETLVRLREAEVERLQSRLGELQLIAPFSGSIVTLETQVGDSIRPYQSVGVLADPTQLEVEATVPEADLPWVSEGQEAQVVMDGFPGQKYPAKVRQIASKPTLWQGKQVYQVRLGFADGAKVPATIRRGSDVSLAVTKTRVLTLPVAALSGEEGKHYVEVPAGATTRKVSIEVGVANETEAEILSGLREGDEVVLRPASQSGG